MHGSASALPAADARAGSPGRSKWGNKVLRWYQDRQLDVTPVHPKESHVEGLEAVKEAVSGSRSSFEGFALG